MQKEVAQLQVILQQLIAEHDKLLNHLASQQLAMKKMDLNAIDKLTGLQDATRMRIAALDSKRKTLVTHLALNLKFKGGPTQIRLAKSIPQHKKNLLALHMKLNSK